MRNIFRSKLVVHGTIMEEYMIGQEPYILVKCYNMTLQLSKIEISEFLEVKYGLPIIIHFIAKKNSSLSDSMDIQKIKLDIEARPNPYREKAVK